MYDLKCTCPTTKLRIDELTKCSFRFRQFIHSFYERPLFLDSTTIGAVIRPPQQFRTGILFGADDSLCKAA